MGLNVFPVDQETPASAFDGGAAERGRAFVLANEENTDPERVTISNVGSGTYGPSSPVSFEIPFINRILNVSQSVPGDGQLDLYTTNPGLLRRNWTDRVPYSFRWTIPNVKRDVRNGDYVSFRIPSVTIEIRSGSSLVDSLVLPRDQAGAIATTLTGNSVTGPAGGRFDNFQMNHFGSIIQFTAKTGRGRFAKYYARLDRSGLGAEGQGFIQLTRDEFVRIIIEADINGSGHPAAAISYVLTASSIGLATDPNQPS